MVQVTRDTMERRVKSKRPKRRTFTTHRTLHASGKRQNPPVLLVVGGLVMVVVVVLLLFMYDSSESVEYETKTTSAATAVAGHPWMRRRGTSGTKQQQHVRDEASLAMAQDIWTMLDCHQGPDGTNETTITTTTTRGRRRLEQQQQQQQQQAVPLLDDDIMFEEEWNEEGLLPVATAKVLFCKVAAAAMQDNDAPNDDNNHNKEQPQQQQQDEPQCNVRRQGQKLLELWSEARAKLPFDILQRVLDTSMETPHRLLGTDVNLWAPHLDTGMTYMIAHVNDETKTVDEGGLFGITNLGPGRVFVDVGSCLGITSMAVALLYPGTNIVSVEAAGPNWLLQKLNWHCNADKLFVSARPTLEKQTATRSSPGTRNSPTPPTTTTTTTTKATSLTLLHAGVGPAHEATVFAKLLWRSHQVTATRSWTPISERNDDADVEIAVSLEPWHAILVQAELTATPHDKATIDVLNVDCAGCEYNLIPAMTEDEFQDIATIMGGVHWGFIPMSKKPSTERGTATHKRLCQHENFATTAKECCQFLDGPVISSFPGEVLYQSENERKSATVRDVAGDFCDDFQEWAKEKHLFGVESDFGWFQTTSTAEE